jgi:DNA-binding transcriptional LysR family regulator
MPELKQLRVLRAVAEAGSFSAAADELDYTQPAVSRIVASLERELGTVLIDRDIRPLRLTDAGEALVRHSEQVFEQLVTAEAEIQAIARLDSGTLGIGTFSSAGVSFLVTALREFRRRYPAVEVSIAEGLPSALIRGLRAGDHDLAVVFDYPQVGEDISEGLEFHHLVDDPFELVVPPDHRLTGAPTASFADLADEGWMLPAFGPESPSLRLIGRACAAAGFEPRVVFKTNDCQLMQALVAAGEGIAVLPRLMLHPVRSDVRVRSLGDEALIRRIAAVRLPTRYLTPAAEEFLQIVRRAARQDQDRS